jgi:hypothetical protein
MDLFEVILLVAGFGAFVFIGLRDMKNRKDREEHEEWLGASRDCLYSIEYEFRRRCEEKTKTYFNKYSDQLYHMPHLDTTVREYKIRFMFDNVQKYREEIDELKNEYLNEVYAKSIQGERHYKYRLNSLPKYVVKEYERNITEIADTFKEFSGLMWWEILDIRNENKE